MGTGHSDSRAGDTIKRLDSENKGMVVRDAGTR
jgi:hypothetical protein